MLYLAGQIILFLTLSALIGFAVGWLARHWLGSRHHNRQLADLQRELETSRSLLRTTQDRASALAAQVRQPTGAGGSPPGSDALDARVHDLEEELDASRSALADLEARVLEIDALRIGIADRDTRIGELEDQVDELGAALDDKDARLAELAAGEASESGGADEEPRPVTSADVAIAAERLGEMTPAEAAAVVAERSAVAEDVADDDLTAIRGIGPKLEALLRGLGIRTFRQIAAWDAEDVAAVSAALPAFSGRILRDDWVGGAREEHAAKYGEAI